MRSPRPFVISVTVALIAITAGCGSKPKTFNVKSVKQELAPMRTVSPDVYAAADVALAFRKAADEQFVMAVISAEQREQQRVEAVKLQVRVDRDASTRPPAAASSSDVFACIANAETGNDWTMHGSTYSTKYGLVNDIIRDYGSPEVQARVFSGTASDAEQLDIVRRFTGEHGFGGFGSLTRQKCNL